MSSAASVAPEGPPFSFTAESETEAQQILAKYPPDRRASGVMPLLHLAQRQNGGWLTLQALDYVAGYLGMPPIRVYEVATFYTMFNLRPIGRHHVQVCTNLACWLRGSEEIVETCRKRLGVALGETTSDGLFTLSEVECLGACVHAPMMQVDDDYYEDLSPESTQRILDALAKGETPKTGSQIGRIGAEPVGGLTSLSTYYQGVPAKPGNPGGDN